MRERQCEHLVEQGDWFVAAIQHIEASDGVEGFPRQLFVTFDVTRLHRGMATSQGVGVGKRDCKRKRER